MAAATTSYWGTVECYDCHKQVRNLTSHRKGECTKAPLKECYDCHEHVLNLKLHRKTCMHSRAAKASIGTMLPDDDVPKLQPKPKDNTDHYLLLDVSGSMCGFRLEKAKQTLTSLIEDLPDKDRMAIITFDSKAFFKLKPRPIGQIRRQRELPSILSKIFAKGMTALYDAIHLAVMQIKDKDIRTVINVLTDGEDNSSSHSLAEVQQLIDIFPNITLNIVHIGDSPIKPYQSLTENRGVYVMITEVEIVVKLRAVFLA